jgi:hypothetical protein
MSQTHSHRIHIVAGNYEEFREYKNKKFKEWSDYWQGEVAPGQRFPEYQFVQHPEQLRGLSEIRGYYIGTYKRRSDIEQIQFYINEIKARSVLTNSIKSLHYTVVFNGVTLDPEDYGLDIVGDSVNLKFTQAPPASSSVLICRSDGVLISRSTPPGVTTMVFDFPPYVTP